VSATETASTSASGWRCPRCNRAFERTRQAHSCRTVSLEDHLRHGPIVQALFDRLVNEVERQIGRCEVVSLPCCIHLRGTYDFLAVLPKRDRLEVRFTLERRVESPRIDRSEQTSRAGHKHRLYLVAPEDVDAEFLGWVAEAYRLREALA
jgi:hypothetical protein